MNAKNLKIFLVDGTIDGRVVAEIGNWSGIICSAQKKDINDFLKLEQINKKDRIIYLLLKNDYNDRCNFSVYVDISSDLSTSLNSHINSFSWDTIYTISDKYNFFTENQFRYLKNKIIDFIKLNKRCNFINTTNSSTISEAKTSEMDYFFDHLKILFSLLNLNLK